MPSPALSPSTPCGPQDDRRQPRDTEALLLYHDCGSGGRCLGALWTEEAGMEGGHAWLSLECPQAAHGVIILERAR